MSPRGFAMESWEGARLSRWHPVLIQQQFPWQTGNYFEWDPEHTAVPVPLQQMPRERLAGHTYCQEHRLPWPLQTAYILHRGVCIGTTQRKILNLDLSFLTWWGKGSQSGIMYLQISWSHCEEAQLNGDVSKTLSLRSLRTPQQVEMPANSTFLWREIQGRERLFTNFMVLFLL